MSGDRCTCGSWPHGIHRPGCLLFDYSRTTDPEFYAKGPHTGPAPLNQVFLGVPVVPDVEVGRKDDDGKARYDLVPPYALEEVAQVLAWGASHYAPDNWRKVEGRRWRYFAAALRHLWAWKRGERLDQKTGRHHLAHAACCVFFLLDEDLQQPAAPPVEHG